MRNFFFYLLVCSALVTACQPVTPTSMESVSPSPKLTTKDSALLSSAQPESSKPPTKPISSGTLLPSNVDQNSNQTEIDLAVSAITTDIDTQISASRVSPDITPQIVVILKTFDPKKIIGLGATRLTRDLGKANMIRKEGPVEVWQYHFTSCVVDFFFYPIDKGKSKLIAKSWDMRSPVMGNDLDRENCRAEMDLYHRKIISDS